MENNHQDLQSLFGKIRELQILAQKVFVHFDPELKKYCQVANLVDRRLIFIVANGSVATQIRFQTIELLQKFKQDPALQSIRDIHCKVRPYEVLETPQPSKKMPLLSPETADTVSKIAESMKDPTLKKILERIAKHTKREPKSNDV